MSVNPDNETSGMTEYERQRITLRERKVTRKIKSIAYLLWFFLGWLMIHRMYLGHFKSATLWCVMFIAGAVMFFIEVLFQPLPDLLRIVVLLLWLACLARWIVDLFRTPGMARNKIQIARNKVQAEEERRIWEEKEEALRHRLQAEEEHRIWGEKEEALRHKVQAEEEQRIREEQEEALRREKEASEREREPENKTRELRMSVTNPNNETSGMTEHERMEGMLRNMWTNIWKGALGIVILLLLVVVILYRSDWGQVHSHCKSASFNPIFFGSSSLSDIYKRCMRANDYPIFPLP